MRMCVLTKSLMHEVPNVSRYIIDVNPNEIKVCLEEDIYVHNSSDIYQRICDKALHDSYNLTENSRLKLQSIVKSVFNDLIANGLVHKKGGSVLLRNDYLIMHKELYYQLVILPNVSAGIIQDCEIEVES